MSFTVYRSSAGSGKTFTLVREYLRLILGNPGEFRHVLAITFTNKAANEMKERVLSALEEISHPVAGGGHSSRMAALLEVDTGMSSTELATAAGKALEMILHNYSDFAVGTIDSFSHRLIRTFAHDFGLPVNFNVELDSGELLQTAVDLLLDRVGGDGELTTFLVNFLEARMEEDKGWNISGELIRFAKELLDEEGQMRIAATGNLTLADYRRIAVELYRSMGQFERSIIGKGRQGARLLTDAGLDYSDLYQGKKGVLAYFSALADGRMEKLEPNSYVKKSFEEDKWLSGKPSPNARAALDAILPQLRALYEAIRAEAAAQQEIYQLRSLLASTIYPLGVLREIGRALDEFKRQNNIVHISEFNSRISAIVMNEPVPFIYERLGEKFTNLLIDEFQDTSVLQWMNFVPLFENALAGGYFTLVVGDGKQAIYRFRGGDVEQFTSLPGLAGSEVNPILRQREESLARHYKPMNLARNFRSRAEIVDFNNRFFRHVADIALTGGKEHIFDGLEQEFDPKRTGGVVNIRFIDKSEGDYRELTLQAVRGHIDTALAAGYRLRDIAVLCRSNRNASDIAVFLLGEGIDVVSAESLLLSSSPAVSFVVACLKIMYEPANDIVKAEAARFLELEQLPAELLEDHAPEKLSVLPLYDLCEELIRMVRRNAATDPYLRFFLAAVLRFTAREAQGAPGFLEWWEKNAGSLSIVVPEELDAVRILTIHKSKGLEYPVVILPFANDPRKYTRSFLWAGVDDDIAEGLGTGLLPVRKELETTRYSDIFTDEQEKSALDLVNLLYVALTRAAERLFILTKIPPKNGESAISLPVFFKSFLEKEGRWSEDEKIYEYGTAGMPGAHGSHHGPAAVTLPAIACPGWNGRVAIRKRAPERWDSDSLNRKTKRGQSIHALMAEIRVAEDIPAAIRRALQTGIVSADEQSEAASLLDAIVNHEMLKELFSPQAEVRTETEILLPGGEFYRPDRVVHYGGTTTVIDYKTGKPSETHRGQLDRYGDLLTSMGYGNLRKLLVYLGDEIGVTEV